MQGFEVNEVPYWVQMLASSGKGLRLLIHNRRAEDVELIHEPTVYVRLSGESGCRTVDDIVSVINQAIEADEQIKETLKFYSWD